MVDDILRQGVQGITDLITVPGLINLDFADVRTIMREAGSALMGIGVAQGENRAVEAARAAISSPLLETTLDGATGILLNITGGPDLGLAEVDEAAQVVTDAADSNANVIFGAVIDESMGDDVRVTAIATGFGGRPRRRRVEAPGRWPSPSRSGPRSMRRACRRRDRHPVLPQRGLTATGSASARAVPGRRFVAGDWHSPSPVVRVAPRGGDALERTPLYERHVALGARMVPFAGYEMPVQYEGVIEEHRAVRTDAGAFDVSHMGEIHVDGPSAQAFLQAMLSNDLDKVSRRGGPVHAAHQREGGIVDDLIAYRLAHGQYLPRGQRVQPRGGLRAG